MTEPATVSVSTAQPEDFFQLLKPRVMSLVIFTAVTGLVVAGGALDWLSAAIAILCIAVGAGAAGALNMALEGETDALMRRTRGRPVAAGRVSKNDAMTFGVILSVFSVMLLGMTTNWLAGGLLLMTILYYAVFYTLLLKRRTPQNIVIGGAAGAAPPVLGWAAISNTVDPHALLLFLIIFIWTPPHFWALAIFRREDYARALIPMLPVIYGVTYTRWQILFYTILLFIATLLPWITGMSGLFYLGGAVVLGAVFLYYAIRLMDPPDELFAMEVFKYSIWYLMALFAFLLIDHWIMPPTFSVA